MNEIEKQQRIEFLQRQIEKNQAEIRRKLKEERIETYNVGEKVHKKQIAFHTSPKRMKAFFGGNRVGKTVAGAVEAVCHAIGYSRFRKLKPSSGWVVSLSGDIQRDVAQKEIGTWLPKKEIKDFVMRQGSKSDPWNGLIDKILLKNGHTIGFKTCEQGRESFQGTSLGWIWADEEPPKDIYDECKMRIIDTRGDMWFTMTPLKGLTFVYNLFMLNETNDPDIEYWSAEWEDNPWLSKEEIDKLVSTMTEEEREARQFGRFTSLCGFAFPELRKDIHIKPIQAVPDWYKRYVSLDYGFDSLAALWYWVDNYGHARIYKALRKKNLIISDAAKEILKFTGNDRIEAFYAPPDLWNRRQDTGKSAAMIFYENGVTLVKTSNDREQGWLNVHEWLRPYETRDEQTGETYKTANMTFDEGLDPDLWKHLTTIQRSDKNPNDVATQPHEVTHYPDSLRCFCVSRMIASPVPETEKHYNFNFERQQDEKNGYSRALGDSYDEGFFNYGG
jgi:phage terminase large subunit-like protein